MFEDENRNWEAELHRYASELLASRLTPLHAELEQLQAAVTAASARLQEQSQAPLTPTESANLASPISEYLQIRVRRVEEEVQNRLQQELATERTQLEAEIRQRLETEFHATLEEQLRATKRETESELELLRNQLATASANQPLTITSPPALTAQYTLLKNAVEEIDAQRTQSETLIALINSAAKFAPRVAFFVVKSGDAVGWRTVGFDNGLSDEAARSLNVSIQSPSLIGQALSSHRTAIALNPTQAEITLMLSRFSHPVPQGAVAVPLVVRGKAAAVLYADSGTQSDEAIQLEAIEALIQVASMAIELLPSRRNAGDLGRSQPHAQAAQAPISATTVSPAVPTTVPVEPSASASAMESPFPASVAEQAKEHIEAFAPITQKPAEVVEDVGGVDNSIGQATNSPFVTDETESVAAEAVQEETPRESVEPVSPYATFNDYVAPAEPAYPNSVEPAASATSDASDEKPSIYDLLRSGPGEAIPPVSSPGLSLPGYAPPDNSAFGKLGGAPGEFANKPGLSLPGWMQRLQDDTEPEGTASPFSTNANLEMASWPTSEEAIPPIPKAAPPPPPPPPVKPSSLPENLGLTPSEVETDRLTSPPAAQPFQVEAPSVRISFNQPSEPPRYAAPSLSVSNAATETEVRAHNDARRFARLLVSEIKLYNAAKVNEGRRLSDLYDRLKDEVDRSRKVYDKRVSPAVAAKFDYFYDELVQTLAEGDPSKLGENCPGPVVLTA